MSVNNTNASYRSLIKEPYKWSYTGDIDIVAYNDVNSSNFSYWTGFKSNFAVDDKINVITPGGTFSTSISTGLTIIGTYRNLVIDSSDNIYIAGKDISTGQQLIKKYNSSGVLQWTATYSVETSILFAPNIVVNNSGEVFAGSTSRVTGVNGTFSAKKFNSSGVLQSSFNPGAPFGASTISCDNNYVYMGSGNTIRRTNFNFGSASTFTASTTTINNIIPNNTGDIYISSSTGGQTRVQKLNSSGTTLWTTDIGGATPQAWRNMELDKANNRVFVVRVDNSSIATSSNIYIINTSGTITGSFSTSPVPNFFGFNALRYKNNELYVSAGNQYRKYSV